MSKLSKIENEYLEELIEFLEIPSISTQTEHQKDILRAAHFLQKKLKDIGMDKTILMEENCYPVVYSEKIVDSKYPTILIYGHYDVQPVDPIEEWESPPFEPTIKNGRIYCRGAADDKGQVYVHIKAIEELIKSDDLKCNVKFIIEGQEESGSDVLDNILNNEKQNKNFDCDVILISDTEMIGEGIPSMPISLRGISAFDIEVTGPNNDLHSGVFGGAVANPIEALSQIIASLKDDKERIRIPNFYRDVKELTPADKKEFSKIPFDIKNYKKDIDQSNLLGERGYSFHEQVGIRPSLTINGIWGGYTESTGFKTVLPSKAYAKLSIRFVPNQNAEELSLATKKYLEDRCPKECRIKVKIHPGTSNACQINPDSDNISKAKNAYKKIWGREPILTRGGGSIPIISKMQEVLGADIVMMGFGLHSDSIHSPNESFRLDHFFNGIRTSIEFIKQYNSIS